MEYSPQSLLDIASSELGLSFVKTAYGEIARF